MNGRGEKDRRRGRWRGRSLFRSSCLLVLSFLTLAITAIPRPAASTAAAVVEAVESVGFTVADTDRAIDFYSRILTFGKISDVEVWGEPYERLQGVFGARMRVVRMKLGDEIIELTEYLAPKGRPIPVDMRSNDRAFQHIAIIVTDMAKAYSLLRSHKVTHASTGPQRLPDWNKNAGGIEAFYFKDPDGHHLEILAFPPGKGDAKWHRSGDRLFLGIDHTAIVVENTESSLRFYRDTLGMQVAGESENYGTEQEHLNNVFGARLRITAVRAQAGPGIEFLEYKTPRDGRPYPADARANDLVHWQTRLAGRNLERAAERLAAARTTFVSRGIVEIPRAMLGFEKGILVRDPDGHAVQLVEGPGDRE